MAAPVLTASSQPPVILRHIEPGITLFTASELHVAVIPIGKVPQDILIPYYTLVTRHRQVELQTLRSFYKDQGKSPFRSFPWKTGSIHFRFLPADMALQANPLKELHTYRKILGVIGICHCPAVADLRQAYSKFEQACRAYPDAFVLRCFAFAPSDAQVGMPSGDMPQLMMFPPTLSGLHQLESSAEVFMLDFAASLLAELEKWMSSASTAMVNMASYADSDAFVGPVSVVEEVHKRLTTDEEMMRKRRYGRLRKAMGDVALLAGSPADAAEHYATAVDLARPSADFVWCAAALEGRAHAQIMEECMNTGALRRVTDDASPARRGRVAELQADDQASVASTASRGGSPFGGQSFWAALRGVQGLERDVRALYLDAKLTLRRKGGLPMQVEQDLKIARFLVGLGGLHVKSEVSNIVSNMVEAGSHLTFPQDKLLTLTEAAQVLGSVGASRKRALHMWQAIDTARDLKWLRFSFLQTARKALEPPEEAGVAEGEEELLRRRKTLGAGVPRHWGTVRAACIDGILSLSTDTNSHADVWDAAARLLSDHHRDLDEGRQAELCKCLEIAAKQMSAEDKARLGLGPPPLLSFVRALPPPVHLFPRRITPRQASASLETAKSLDPFIYNPAARDRERGKEDKDAEALPCMWVANEHASVEIEISNPTHITFQISRMTLEVQHVGDPSVAPRDQSTAPAWKPSVVSVNLPALTGPSSVTLKGTPLVKGVFVVVGCRLTWAGVTWLQPWSPRQPKLPWLPPPGHHDHDDSSEAGGAPLARVTVVDAMPCLEVRLDTPLTSIGAAEAESAGSGDRMTGSGPLDRTAGSSSSSQGGARPAQKGQEGLRPPPISNVVALKGQILHWRLICLNRGALPVAAASLATEAGAVKERRSREVGATPETPAVNRSSPAGPSMTALQCTADASHLSQHLPLQPRDRAVVPIIVHAPQVSSYTSEDEASVEFKLEYMGTIATPVSSAPAASPIEADETGSDASPASEQPNLGRRVSVPVQLQYRPSLQVTGISFSEHHASSDLGAAARQHRLARTSSTAEPLPPETIAEPGLAGARGMPLSPFENGDEVSSTTTTSSCTVDRLCVIEAEVVNRTELALQVWLGRRGKDADAAWDTVRSSPRPWDRLSPEASSGALNARCKLASGRQKAQVALPLQLQLPHAQVAALVAAQAGLVKSKRGAPTREELVRQACADLICRQVALYWRREDLNDADAQMEGGCLPLPSHSIAASLTPAALSILSPGELQISLAAGTPGSPAAEPVLLRTAGETEDDGLPQLGAVWGLEATAGHMVPLSVQVTSQAQQDSMVQFSISAQAYGEVSEGHSAHDSPHVALSGTVSGVQLHIPAGGQATHAWAAMFLLPGLYKLYTHTIAAQLLPPQTLPAPAKSSLACELSSSAAPLYVYVLHTE